MAWAMIHAWLSSWRICRRWTARVARSRSTLACALAIWASRLARFGTSCISARRCMVMDSRVRLKRSMPLIGKFSTPTDSLGSGSVPADFWELLAASICSRWAVMRGLCCSARSRASVKLRACTWPPAKPIPASKNPRALRRRWKILRAWLPCEMGRMRSCANRRSPGASKEMMGMVVLEIDGHEVRPARTLQGSARAVHDQFRKT